MGNGYQQESFQKTTPKPRKNPDQTDVNSREKWQNEGTGLEAATAAGAGGAPIATNATIAANATNAAACRLSSCYIIASVVAAVKMLIRRKHQ
eukprot:gene1774-4886_t